MKEIKLTKKRQVALFFIESAVCLMLLAWFAQSDFLLAVAMGWADLTLLVLIGLFFVWVFNFSRDEFAVGLPEGWPNNALNRAYYRVRTKVNKLIMYPTEENKDLLRGYLAYQKILFYLILLFQRPEVSFTTLKDHFHELSHEGTRLLLKYGSQTEDYFRHLAIILKKKRQRAIFIFLLVLAAVLLLFFVF